MMFGPKKTSLLACVPICLAWVLMSRADDIYVVYTSRMLTGHILKHILVALPVSDNFSTTLGYYEISQIANCLGSINTIYFVV